MIIGFNIDIYDCNVVFVWNTDQQELEEFFRSNENQNIPKEYQEEILANLNTKKGTAFTGPLSDTDVITVFLSDTNYRTVAHEIYHLCAHIMTKRGIEDEEAWAYLIGYITEMYYKLKEENK